MCTLDRRCTFGSFGANGDASRVKTLGEAAFGHAALDTRFDETRVLSEICGFPNSTPGDPSSGSNFRNAILYTTLTPCCGYLGGGHRRAILGRLVGKIDRSVPRRERRA